MNGFLYRARVGVGQVLRACILIIRSRHLKNVTVTFLLVWQSVLGPLASAADHPLNPSGEGQVVIPSPFDTQYPFPLYIPREIQADLIEMTQNAGGSAGSSDLTLEQMRDRVQHGLGVYPYGVVDSSGPESPEIVRQVSFLKPFSDEFLFGGFFKGPKRHWLNQLQALYLKVRESIPPLMTSVKQGGQLLNFGSFNDDAKRFQTSHRHLGNYLNALREAHDLLQTLLYLPTENVDPDVVLDMINAMGIGPQVWDARVLERVPTTESLLKYTAQRFCATTYVYRYVRAYQEAEKQPLVDLNVDEFAAPYLRWEATGDDLLGMTLTQRKAAYRRDYQDVVRDEFTGGGVALSEKEKNAIVGVSVTWARVPIFYPNEDTGEMTSTDELFPVWIPLVAEGATLRVPDHFVERYLPSKANTLVQSMPEGDTQTFKDLHRKSFLSSLGYPLSAVENDLIYPNDQRTTNAVKRAALDLARAIQNHVWQYLRIQDQFLVFRGLYEGKNFGVVTSDGRAFTRDFDITSAGEDSESPKNVFGRFQRVWEDPRRSEIEGVVPQLLCEGLYRRNYTTQILLTHEEVSQPSNVERLPDEHDPNKVAYIPMVARSWLQWAKSSDLGDVINSALRGVWNPQLERWVSQDPQEMPVILRPWALYLKGFHSDLKPEANMAHPRYLHERPERGMTATLFDWILPRFFSRFGHTDSFLPILWTTGLPIRGENSLRPNFDSWLSQLPEGDRRLRYQPYDDVNYLIAGTDAPDAQMLVELDSTEVDIAGRWKKEELQKLSQHLWRSRILFTPQEWQLMLVTYFKEFLLPLALLQRFVDADQLRESTTGAAITQLKQFYVPAGVVNHELLYLLQNKTDNMLDLRPTVLSGETLQPVWDPQMVSGSVAPAMAGYVISFASLWAQQTEPTAGVPEWSKHDRLLSLTHQMERHLNKRVYWCQSLPAAAFASLAKQEGLPPASVQELVCALPGYFPVSRALGLFLAKEHLRFESLKYYFEELLKRKNENRSLLPFLSQVPEMASLNRHMKTPDVLDRSGKPIKGTGDTDVTLAEGIAQYQELVEMVFAYREEKLGLLGAMPSEIAQLFDYTESQFNWGDDRSHPLSHATTELYGVAVTDENFTHDCAYIGTQKNPLDHEQELYDLKMLCLYNHVVQVRKAFLTPSPFRHALEERWLSPIRKLQQGQEGKAFESYMAEVAQILGHLSSGTFVDDDPKDCVAQTFEMQPPLQALEAETTFEGRVSNATAHMINTLDTQNVGHYIQEVVGSACPAVRAQEKEKKKEKKEAETQSMTFSQLMGLWQQLATRLAEDPQLIPKFFGENVLFVSSFQEPTFGKLSKDMVEATEEFLRTAQAARSRKATDGRTDDQTNLVAELTGVYREIQFEQHLNSLVAIKTAMIHRIPEQLLRGQEDPLKPIASGQPHTSYVQAIDTITEVGNVDLSLLPLVGGQFSYNRESGSGQVLAAGLDLLGMGESGSPGTIFKTENDNWAVTTWIDQSFCHWANANGGSLMPWASMDHSTSVRDALNPLDVDGSAWDTLNPLDGWHWRGRRTSFSPLPGLTHHKATVVDPRYFCDLKYTFPPAGSDFRPLTAREQELIDEANAFLEEVRELRRTDQGRAQLEQARYEIESELAQAVVSRIFVDKLTAHVLIPYQEALGALQTLLTELKYVIRDYRSSPHLAALVHEKLTAFYDPNSVHEKKRIRSSPHFQKFFYLRQLFWSMMETLFPGGRVRGITDSPEQRQAFLRELFVAFGSLGHLVGYREGITADTATKQGVKYSLVAHIHQVIADIEAFNAEVGGRLVSRYPILERETMQRADGSQDAVDAGADTPKIYQVLFALPTFESYRKGDVPARLNSPKANAALANAMPQANTFYTASQDKKAFQDNIDTALQQLVENYPFSPSDVLVHALSSSGKPYGDQTARTSFLGDRDVLPADALNAETQAWKHDEPQGYKSQRLEVLRQTVHSIFSWHSSDGSLSEYLNHLETGQEAHAGSASAFIQAMSSGADQVFDFSPASDEREAFSQGFDRLLVLQRNENDSAMQRTFRALYEGKFVAEGPDLSTTQYSPAESTLVELFSHEGIIQNIQSRFGDRFLELEYEYVPSRVYSYMEQKEAYMNIMADLGKIMMGVILGLMVITVLDLVIGTKSAGAVASRAAGEVTKQVTRSVMSRLLRFSVRFALVMGVRTLAVYALFSLLSWSMGGGQVPFMPVLILVMMLSFFKALPVGQWAQRKVSKKLLQGLRTAVQDVLIGVILMDAVGMVLDWEIANYTSRAYAQASALFFGYMRLGRVYSALYGPSFQRHYEPLIRDHQYFAYLKQAKIQNFSFAVLGTLMAGTMNMFYGVRHGKRLFHRTPLGVSGQVTALKHQRLSRAAKSAGEWRVNPENMPLGSQLTHTLTPTTAQSISGVALANEGFMRQFRRLRKEQLLLWTKNPELRTRFPSLGRLDQAMQELEDLHGRLQKEGEVSLPRARAMQEQTTEILKRIHQELNDTFVSEGNAILIQGNEPLREALEAYRDVVAEMNAIRELVRSPKYQAVAQFFERTVSDRELRGQSWRSGSPPVTQRQRVEAAYQMMEGDLSLSHLVREVQPYYFARSYRYTRGLSALSETFRWPLRYTKWALQGVGDQAMDIYRNPGASRAATEALERLLDSKLPEGVDGDVFSFLRANPQEYLELLIENRLAIPEVVAYVERHPKWKGRHLMRTSVRRLQEDLDAIRITYPDGTAATLDEFFARPHTVMDLKHLAGMEIDFTWRSFETREGDQWVSRHQRGRLGEQLIRLVDDAVASGRLRPVDRSAVSALLDGEFARTKASVIIPWDTPGHFAGERVLKLEQMFAQDPEAISHFINAVTAVATRHQGTLEDAILMRLGILDVMERINGRAYVEGPVVTQLFSWEDLQEIERYQRVLGDTGETGSALSTQLAELLMNRDRQQVLRARADSLGFDVLFSQVRHVSSGALDGFSVMRGAEARWTELGPFVARSRTVSVRDFDDLHYHPFFSDEKRAIDTGMKP